MSSNMSTVKAVSLTAAFSLLGSISHVSAHGFVTSIKIGGESYPGFNPGAAPYQNPPPPVIGWPNGASDTGFVLPSAYGNGDIVCHLNSRPGERHATVAAGSSIDLQWNQWPESHHGPVIDYMAKCDGECEQADKNSLKFFKIAEAGLVNGAPAPGKWASDDLISNGNTWRVTVPASIAPGNYVLRHEIIALHAADKQNGAQNYPQCINLEVTGSGTQNPAGIPATQFYTPTDPGIFVNIHYPALENYTIPGPALFSGASSGGIAPPSAAISSVAASSTFASSTDASSSTADNVQPTSSITSTSEAASITPSVTAAPFHPNVSNASNEMTSTTTTDTTLTLTIDPESTPTEATPTYDKTSAASSPSSALSTKLPEKAVDGYPSDMVDAPAPSKSSSAGASNTTPADLSAETANPPTDGAGSGDYGSDSAGSGSSGSESPGSSGSALPGGMSLQEFLDWFKQVLGQFFSSDGRRKHARDLSF